MLSSFSPSSVLSLLHAYFHLRFGLNVLLFPGMSTSSILHNKGSYFILIIWPYHFSRFSVIFLDVCTTLVVPLMCSFRIVSLLVTPHIHLSISFTSSRAYCPLIVPPGLCTIQQSWSDHSFVNLSLQFHWHPPVALHTTAYLPVYICCTHSLCIF